MPGLRKSGIRSLGTKFNNTQLNGCSFKELRYFTNVKIISDGSASFAVVEFTDVDFSNITRLETAMAIDPARMYVCSLPNAVYAMSFPKGGSSWTSGHKSYTNVGFYMPKVQEIASIFCNWYDTGIIRWIVIGTDNDTVTTLTGDNSVRSVLLRAEFKGFFVPDSLVEAYKSDTKWGNAANYIHPVSEFEQLTGEALPSQE